MPRSLSSWALSRSSTILTFFIATIKIKIALNGFLQAEKDEGQNVLAQQDSFAGVNALAFHGFRDVSIDDLN